jgi:hypothetical protein
VVNNLPYNIVSPIAGQQYVITDISIFSARSIGSTGTVVEIYETELAEQSTVFKPILKVDLPKQNNAVLTGLNWIVDEGKFLTCRADDTDVLLTVAGYYVNTPSIV